MLLLVNYRPEYQDDWRNRPNYRQLRLDPLASESLRNSFRPCWAPTRACRPSRASWSSAPAGTRSSSRRACGRWSRPACSRASAAATALRGRSPSDRGPGHGAGGAGGAHRRAARRGQAPAAGGRRHRKGRAVRAAAGNWRADRGRASRLLDHLQAAEFLYETQLFPDLEYTFKHALTHEVTYSGLLQERRRELHARIVDAIETLYADRLGEQVERLAHHAVRGELREKAVHYLRQAGAQGGRAVGAPGRPGLVRAGAGCPRGAAGEPVHAGAGLRDPPRAAAGAAPAR